MAVRLLALRTHEIPQDAASWKVERPAGFEPATFGLEVHCSIR